MAQLAGKHALVTGGGSGVGLAIAKALADAGATITITGRSESALSEAANSVAGLSPAVCDVTDPAAVHQVFSEVATETGGIDIVIANAGAAESVPFTDLSPAQWEAMIGVNLTGTFLTFQAGLHAMQGKSWGRLIAIASVAGLKGYGYVSAYCAAKHGVVGLVKSVALETAQAGVTVNAVCPGYTRTPMLERSIDNIMEKTGRSREDASRALLRSNPMGRFIEPEEVAQSVMWLCGPSSGSVTGQAISISGGEI